LPALVRADCEQAEVESVLVEHCDGPFAPLESDWKERVRNPAKLGAQKGYPETFCI
jgi:hypothetical protein